MVKDLLLVGCGGFVGSIFRYLLSKLNGTISFLSLPLGTLTVNVVGSFIIGLLVALSQRSGALPESWRLFLMVGLCGGFTTFSTFSAENMALIQNGHIATAIMYTCLSCLLGLVAVFVGYATVN